MAYLVYAAALVLAIVGVPLVRGLVIGLSGPGVLTLLTAPSAGQVAGVAAGGLLTGLVLLGQVRGPALTSAFLTVAVAGNDLPRSRTLRAPFVVAAALLTTSSVAVAAILARVLHDAAGATAGTAGAIVVGAGAFGLLASVVWLLGQRLGPVPAARLAGALAAATGLGALWPAPGPLAGGPLAPLSILVALSVLVGLSVLAALAIPRLLDSLDGTVLLAQARRWEAAGVSASAGDLAGAMGRFRVLPRTGRTWWAVHSGSRTIRFVLRDLVGALRTPGRAAGGALGLVAAGSLLAAGAEGQQPLTWAATAAGGVVAYLALGVFTDGFRHAAEAASAPALYGYSTSRLFTLHAVLPTACALALTGIGAAATTGTDLTVGATVAALAVVLVLVRVRDSAKGPLPAALLTPAPTPAGDVAGVAVLLWQADAVVVSALVAVAASTAPTMSQRALLVACSGLAVAVGARGRLRRA